VIGCFIMNESVFEDDDCTTILDEESEEEEWEEPKLNYIRMRNDLVHILKDDFVACITIHTKFVALGTHWGAIHVLDHEGNRIRNKEFARHNACVTGIGLDKSAEYVVSCSDDGLVVISGLYSDEHNQIIKVDRSVKSVALDPYYSTSSSKQIVFGTEKLVLCEKGWLRGKKQSILHQGEGLVRKISWRNCLIAWANDNGVKLYDTKQKRRIQHIPRIGAVSDTESTVTGRIDIGPNINGCLVNEYSPAHIAWKDDTTILIGWAYDIKVCQIKERVSRRDLREKTKYCVIVYMFQTDFLCCGVAPLGDQIVAFAYVENEEEEYSSGGSSSAVDDEINEKTRSSGSARPQLRIIEPNPIDSKSYIEISRDALSISGYAEYRCCDYSLEFDSTELLVISPKDVVIAKRRDEDDHVTWLLETNQFREALGVVKVLGKRLKKHTLTDVGLQYLSHLLESGKFEKAAEVCPEILGKNRNLWEETLDEFLQANQLGVVAHIIPHEDFILTSHCYDRVLLDALQNKRHKDFVQLLDKWSNKLYNIPNMISNLLRYIDENGKSKILLTALAKLYEGDQRFDRALSIYLQLEHPDTFELIRRHNLFGALQDNILPLMRFGDLQAIELLLDNMDYVPIDKVVKELEQKPNYQHKYLNALFNRDSHLGSEYHGLQVRLYADFDVARLLPFLKTSNYVPLEEALEICEKRDLIDEQVFLLGKDLHSKSFQMKIRFFRSYGKRIKSSFIDHRS